MSIQNIGIVGVGGVGGYFGGKLCGLLKNGAALRVLFVARGAHLRAIQQSGLLLSSETEPELVCKPTLATDDFGQLPQLNLCLLCVKEFDLPAVLQRLAPLCSDETILLPLLNGVDVYQRVRRIIKNGIVLPACVYVGTHIERPGKVVQKGGACKILFGPDPQRPEFAADDVVKIFDQARIKSEWTTNIQAEIWQKFIFICAFGLVSAAYDKTLGEILEDDPLRSEAQSIMLEVASLARLSGVTLPNDIAEVSLAKAGGFPYAAKTSFQRDFERSDKKDERDLFAGTMIRMADEMGITLPRIRAVSEMLETRKPAQRAPA